MRFLLKGAIVFFALLLLPAQLQAQDGLVLLKTVRVDLGVGTQSIDLSDSKGAFRAVRLKAIEGRVRLDNVIVGYLGAPDHNERRLINLLTGERTREINPTPEGLFLREITLEYQRVPGAAATLEIYGRQAPEDAARERDAPDAVAEAPRKKTAKRKGARRPASRSAQSDDEMPAADPGPPEVASAPPEAAPPPASAPGAAPATPPSTTTRAAAASPVACVVENTCTPVQVFFGTNRERQDLPKRIAFSWKDSGALALGGAVVTVPRKVRRDSGSIQRPSWWDRNVLRIPPEGDPARHFVIVPNLLEVYSDEASFLAAVARHMENAGDYKDHAFIYVHGYRVGFDDALYRTAQIAYDLGSPRESDGVIVPFGSAFLYSWPSAGQLKDYPYDQESARLAVRHLKEFLDVVIARTGVKHVHLVAHSMGNVPLLNALGEFVGQETADAKVSQVILAAPDIGRREFSNLAARIKPLAAGFTLYASSSDLAMEASRKVHKNEPRAGDVVDGKPVLATGVDTIDISAITTCYFCFGHDEYVEQDELLGDIAKLMRAGLRPPHSRTETFRIQETTEVPFWRYQP
jgi:esterase/lipase superfamily enzyme